jgi:hypothetical protein
MNLLNFLFWGAGSGAPPTTQDIDVTDTGLYFSPFNTYSDGVGAVQSNNVRSDATHTIWNSPGAYLKFNVTIASGGAGVVKLYLDTTSLQTLTASKCPTLVYHVDDKVFSSSLLAYSAATVELTLGSGLAVGTHSVAVYFKSIDLNTPGDRWTPLQAVKITGLQIDATASIPAYTPRTYRMLWYGDSSGEGASVVDENADNASNDATQCMVPLVARALDAEVGNVSYGGCGYLRGIDNEVASSTNPALQNATSANEFYDKYHSGADRDFSDPPDFVFIEMGGNDSGLTAQNVTDAIDKVRTAVGASAWIFPVTEYLPAASSKAATIASGTAAAAQTFRTINLVPSVLLTPTAGVTSLYSEDAELPGAHLNVRGHAHHAAEIIQLAQEAMGGGAPMFIPVE